MDINWNQGLGCLRQFVTRAYHRGLVVLVKQSDNAITRFERIRQDLQGHGGKPRPRVRQEMKRMLIEVDPQEGEEHKRRVRRICMSMPRSEEKLSHGEPTWFVRKKVFVMFANNHHNDGRVAVWLPTLPGMQPSLIARFPKTFFRPPYVGVKGWVGIELDHISDDELALHIHEAWKMIVPKSLVS